FTYKFSKLRAGDTREINLSDFTKPDGTRFNPSSIKLIRILIVCTTPRGGFWLHQYGVWQGEPTQDED
ncbi:MAG TPA: hypothetical protein VLQ80_18000, partial [Candidatus Saccharimonadia bacterium]|nr:hypothetical protein [Candidatus Saccharimonadia bacterium]